MSFSSTNLNPLSVPHENRPLGQGYIKDSSPSTHNIGADDLEAQTISPGRRGRSYITSHTRASRSPTPFLGHGSPQPWPPVSDDIGTHASPEVCIDAENSKEGAGQSESEWKPWKLEDPYHVKMPKSQTTMVKAMEVSDDGMCKGWRDQIDTLIIFVCRSLLCHGDGLSVESYKWLEETPADTLARLQLRALLNAIQNPATDRLAPAAFNISVSTVLINALWLASLTLALATVVVSILRKQWLYEYQRYDNFATKESFLIHGLRYRGLQAWRVPEIIASLPLLLQTALVLFLVGVLVLLGPLQTVVASLTIAIVGLTFLFLCVTTMLPAIQYIFPRFHTPCAYKSSQSWSFFLISAFWLFDFNAFTTWTTFDLWEVTCVSNGMGHTLSRVYELLSNSVDAFQSIYSFLADTSLVPTIHADLQLLSDFVDGSDTSRRDNIVKSISKKVQPIEDSNRFQRIEQLKGYIHQYYKYNGRLKLAFKTRPGRFESSEDKCTPLEGADRTHHLRTQVTFCQFLRDDIHYSNPWIFNRYAEHWARCTDQTGVDMKAGGWRIGGDSWPWSVFVPPKENIRQLGFSTVRWDPDIASHLVQMYSHMLKTDRFPEGALHHLSTAYPSLMESYRQRDFEPPPFTLLRDIQDWINKMPDSGSDLRKKIDEADHVLFSLACWKFSFVAYTPASDAEKRHLESFAQFFLDFFGREDVSHAERRGFFAGYREPALAGLRKYIDQNPFIISES